MPLHILLPMVVVGIAGIALVLHLSGHSARFVLNDDAVVWREWARHFPQDPPLAIQRTPDAALVRTGTGFGLVRSFGADTVAHQLVGLDPVATGLRARFADFAFPDVVVTLTPAEQALWLAEWRGQDA